ncbi:MAG: M16 family metallopeptidase, partial [Planctomycetota bacterium]
VEPRQCGQRRVEVRRPGNAVHWICLYHVPEHAHPDRLPLMVLEAVLSGARPLSLSGGGYLGKSARLHDALVNRKKVAVSAGGRARFMRDPGLFVFSMMLRDGVKPQKAERAMFAEIEKLRGKGPRPAELKKARRQVQAQIEYARDGISANAYMIGDLDSLGSLDEVETLAERVAAVTAEDVLRVAQSYLAPTNCTIGLFIPEGAGGGAPSPPPPDAALAWPAEPGSASADWPKWGAFWRPPGRCSWCAPAPAGGGAASPVLPVIRERTLDCGVRVLGVEIPASHCVAVRGFLRAGSALDPPDKEGTACLSARMLDQGTAARSCRQIAARTDGLGASIGFGAGADSTDLAGKCLPGDLRAVLGLIRECLAESAFPAAELEKVRQQVLTSMKSDRDSTSYLAGRAALEGLYPAGHPYHRDHRGSAETVARIGREALVEFARRWFWPENLTLALVGPVPFDRVCRAVEKAFGEWHAQGRPAGVEPTPLSSADSPGERVMTVPGKSQCDLVVARMAVPRNSADYHGLLVASTIFGRFGLMGRIGERVRDELGLAYYAFASLSARLAAGHWEICAGVNPANVRKALDAIAEETERFHDEPVSEGELSDTVGHLVGSLALRMETSDSLVGLVREIAFHRLPLDYLELYRAEVEGTDPQRVLALAKQYLGSAEPVVAIAGPELPDGA